MSSTLTTTEKPGVKAAQHLANGVKLKKPAIAKEQHSINVVKVKKSPVAQGTRTTFENVSTKSLFSIVSSLLPY